MKRATFIVTVDCRDDVPPHVLEWMAGNLRQHSESEFAVDYDPEFVDPPYEGPPLDWDGRIEVQFGTLTVSRIPPGTPRCNGFRS